MPQSMETKELHRKIEWCSNYLQNDSTQLENNASFKEYKVKDKIANNIIHSYYTAKAHILHSTLLHFFIMTLHLTKCSDMIK